MWQDNDGRYPDDSEVEVRYPRDKREARETERAGWPWLPGSIVEQCRADEWYVAVCERSLAVLEDGQPAPDGTAEDDLFFKGEPQGLYDHLTCRKTLVRFTSAEGAGPHCQVGASRLAFARMFDWLDETLA